MALANSLDQNQAEIKRGSLSCVTLVQQYLKNISTHQHLNAFIEVYPDEAIAKAGEIDLKFAAGNQGKLAGMVVGIKDLITYKNHQVSAGSKILKGYKSLFSATAVQRLLNEDAIIIGRQNCDEFGMGSSNENSAYGISRNGVDTNRVPGGSSGGSAVAVQMNMCTVSLGTDTGGSVRQPSAFCGVIGLKPTYGSISRNGLISYASSFDTIGVISNHLDDNRKVLEIIAGKDLGDSTSSNSQLSSKRKNSPYKFCYYKELLGSGIGKKELAVFEKQLEALKSAGHTVEAISFPLLEYVVPTYYLLTMAEASSNLSRYDGLRYGPTSDTNSNYEQLFATNRTNGFGDEVKRRVLLGTFLLSSGYYDAYVTKAQRVRSRIIADTQKIFNDYDFQLSPTTPTPAFEIGKVRNNPTEMYLEDIFTVQASLAGLPAISIPFKEKINNLPYGLHITANENEELALYNVAEEIMRLMEI